MRMKARAFSVSTQNPLGIPKRLPQLPELIDRTLSKLLVLRLPKRLDVGRLAVKTSIVGSANKQRARTWGQIERTEEWQDEWRATCSPISVWAGSVLQQAIA